MMEWLNDLWNAARIDLPVTFVGALIAYIVGQSVVRRWKEIKYGNWIVRVIDKDGHEATRRQLAPATAERILNDKNELLNRPGFSGDWFS